MNQQRQRFEEKRDFVIHWLLEFQISTKSILCDALRVKRRSQSRFFDSLRKSGHFETVRHPQLLEDLWMLTYQGKQFARELSVEAEKYTAVASRVVNNRTRHTVCIQQAILELIGDEPINYPFTFKSERSTATIDAKKRPDALMTEEGDVIALEVELNQKSAPRIYLAYLDHLENMRADLYEAVHYVFPSQGLCDIYQRRFDAPKWPMYFRDRNNRIQRQMEGDRQVMANADDDEIRSRFSFRYMEAINR